MRFVISYNAPGREPLIRGVRIVLRSAILPVSVQPKKSVGGLNDAVGQGWLLQCHGTAQARSSVPDVRHTTSDSRSLRIAPQLVLATGGGDSVED